MCKYTCIYNIPADEAVTVGHYEPQTDSSKLFWL